MVHDVSRNDPPTARQLEYAQALGIRLPRGVDKDQISALIDRARQDLDGKPTREQIWLAREFSVVVPESAQTRRDYVNLLYSYIHARRWIFSVVRHACGARWRRYDEADLPVGFVAVLSRQLVTEPGPHDTVTSYEEGNSAVGADNWTRLSRKAATTEAYRLVVESDMLPAHIRQQIEWKKQGAAKTPPPAPAHKSFVLSQAKRPRQRSSSGCLLIVVLVVLSTAWLVL